jgi:hypothetical protein
MLQQTDAWFRGTEATEVVFLSAAELGCSSAVFSKQYHVSGAKGKREDGVKVGRNSPSTNLTSSLATK